ncbi:MULTISPECIES: hypothetical protein [Actinomycetes]|uniref:VOC domain-containing protein n=2 Tax=Actinomycetes TaxID=1760 RepID=A0ABP6M1D2_9MICC
MTHHANGSPAHPLCLRRFTERPAAMADFLELLGMTPQRPSREGDAGILRAAAGRVALHQLAPDRPAVTGAVHGETHLVFLAEDARHTAARLQEDGLRSLWWEHAERRHAGVTGPSGEGVWFHEEPDLCTAGPPVGAVDGLTVVAVRSSEDPGADVAFFSHLGYEPIPGEESEGWLPLAVPEAPSGMIGLHAPGGDKPGPAVEPPPGGHNPAGLNAPVLLGFQTPEELDGVAARLEAAGHPVQRAEGPVSALVVRDPDGRRLEIHPA